MDVVTLLGTVLLIVAQPLALVLPYSLWVRISDAAHYHHPYGSWRPGLATFAGVALGAAQVAALWEPNTLTFQAIFHEGGFWDLNIREFWTLVAQRLADGPYELVRLVFYEDERWNYAAIVLTVEALFILDLVLTLAAGMRGPALLAFLLDVTMAVLACGLTIYTVHAGLWLLNRLNFWVFAVAIFLLQDYRYSIVGLFKRRKRAVPTTTTPQEALAKPKGY